MGEIFLESMGALFCLVLCIIAVAFIIEAIKERVHTAKINYRIKHRFDKPPTADCYCVDCCYYSVETNKCFRSNSREPVYHRDNWFCADAERSKKEC